MLHRIVPATPADYTIIQSIAQHTWPNTFGEILSPTQITYMLDMMYSEAAIVEQVEKGHVFHILLVESGENKSEYTGGASKKYDPVGYVSHQLDYLPGTTKIHKIYLLPTYQGKGYGRVMIDHVEHCARRAGQPVLRLDVNYQNAAVGFYEYLGFRKIERCNTDIGNGYLMEDWIMEKPLN